VRDTASGRGASSRGGLTALREVVPQEGEHVAVPVDEGQADLRHQDGGELVVPLGRVGEEPFLVETWTW